MSKRRLVLVLAYLAASLSWTHAHADGCENLGYGNYSQGQLYLVSAANNGGKPFLLNAFGATDAAFNPRVSLIYVVDQPVGRGAPATTRDFSGMFAVRLVSTSAEGTREPETVYLKRDSVIRRQGTRDSLNGNVSAARYYAYHDPTAVRASDSYLQREFHTEYSYRPDELDRNTFDRRDRRSKFHFPEMRVAPPSSDPASKLIASVIGRRTALAAVPESRFEAQIKYYRKTGNTRCLTMSTTLNPGDNGSLNVTMIDLDHPDGLESFSNNVNWRVNWKRR